MTRALGLIALAVLGLTSACTPSITIGSYENTHAADAAITTMTSKPDTMTSSTSQSPRTLPYTSYGVSTNEFGPDSPQVRVIIGKNDIGDIPAGWISSETRSELSSIEYATSFVILFLSGIGHEYGGIHISKLQQVGNKIEAYLVNLPLKPPGKAHNPPYNYSYISVNTSALDKTGEFALDVFYESGLINASLRLAKNAKNNQK
jgi:hypothetical protein